VTSYPDFHEYGRRDPQAVKHIDSSIDRLLDVNNFLLAISFYILAKSGFELVIFIEARGVALRWCFNLSNLCEWIVL
jgi:hypothetical protein